MRRFILFLSLGLVVLLSLIDRIEGSTRAQETTPAAMTNHPVVGGWQWDNDNGDGTSTVSYAVFHPDGTYTEAFSYGVTLIGLWRVTGERSADLTTLAADVEPDPNVTLRAEGRQAVEVDESGTAITAQGSFEVRGADGSVVFAGPAIAQGTRLEVLPVAAVGTPSPVSGAAATPAP